MTTTGRAARAALGVVAGALGVFGAASIAVAQRSHPRVAVAAESAPFFPIPITPYPGATVTIDSRLFYRQPLPPPFHHPPRREPFRNVPATGGYTAYPYGGYSYGGYPYYPTVGYGYGCGGVYDTNGRPLYDCYGNGNGNGNGNGYGYGCGSNVYDTNGRPLSDCSDPSAPRQYDVPAGTPDLSGSPYVVADSGVMVVNFGKGDQRRVPSCTAMAAERTPDGQLRTIFYRPPADGLILRAGQRGQVIGTPPVGTSSCYTTNSFGRVVLDY